MSISQGDLKRSPRRQRRIGFRRPRRKPQVQSLLDITVTWPNVCVPSLSFRLPRRKFSIIWPGIRMRKTLSTASFSGGCSTLASENGHQKLQRLSRNSSNKVFSNKSDLRTATSFTAPPRTISRRFSNRRGETPPLTQLRKPSNKKGQPCLPP